MLWLWFRVSLMRWAAYLGWLRKSSTASGGIKPVLKLDSKKRHSKHKPTSSGPYSAAIWLLATLPLTSCATSETKPPQPDNRTCLLWVVEAGQEIYIAEQHVLIARSPSSPGDAVVSGWCLSKFINDVANETRHLSRH